jgi:hypothetical protein
MTDDEFIAGFEDCSLAGFHHADHVRMAFLYLSRHQALEALQRFSAALIRFAASNGKPELYNETITWAFVFLIRDRMARAGRPQTWIEFAAGNTDLLTWKDNILKRYYRGETLSSDLAKNTFLFPDMIPLGRSPGARPEAALHEDGIEPAPEFEADVLKQPSIVKAETPV